MIRQRLKILLLMGVSVVALYACKPKIVEPTLSSCLITKEDGFSVSTKTINGQTFQVSTPQGKKFDYDEKKRLKQVTYYTDNKVTGYWVFYYDANGLSGSTSYDSASKKTNDVTYTLNAKKKITKISTSYNDNKSYQDQYFFYDSTKNDLPASSRIIDVNYEPSTTKWTIFRIDSRYEYDINNNNTNLFYTQLSQTTYYTPNSTFITNFTNEFSKQKEFLAYKSSVYDNKLNPFRTEPTLAIYFDNLPAYNNGGIVSTYYSDGVTKQEDDYYTWEYNKIGFPYKSTLKVDYSDTETRKNPLNQDYVVSRSYEYKCQ